MDSHTGVTQATNWSHGSTPCGAHGEEVANRRGLCASPGIAENCERSGQTVDFTLREHPRDSVNWRRYRDACPHYRVRWFVDSDAEAGEPFYQVFCLMNTPAETWEEQEKCLSSRTRCWRIAEAQRKAAGSVDIPLASIKRRKPA